MHWSQSLYHDHTPYFLSRLEAGLGEFVTVRLRAPANAPIQKAFLIVMKHGEPQWIPMRALEPGGFWRFFQADMLLESPAVRYSFTVVSGADTVHLTTRGARRFTAPYRDWFQFLPDWHAPDWLSSRVFYQIFPDRFRNGDPTNDVQDGEYMYKGKPVMKRSWDSSPTLEGDVHEFFGGDLQGIVQSLDYLERLGVNALWLTPIFSSPSNHRYDTRDYLEVDPHLGGNRALRELLDAAHARDIRVVLDGVFNHVGNEYAGFVSAIRGGPEREMFNFAPDGTYAAFFDEPTLPKIDYASQMAQDVFLDGPESVVRHWLRFGADGWRLDVAHMIGMNGGDHGNLELLRRLRAAARAEHPQAYIFGERSYDAELALQGPNPAAGLGGGGEDGVMNYHGVAYPLTEWLAGYRIWNSRVRVPSSELSEVMMDAYRALPPLRALSQYNLIGSHDGPRVLWRFGQNEGLLRAGFAVLMAFPGVPSIYYGDEIGLTQPGRPLDGTPMPLGMNRVPFPWDEGRWNTDLLEFVRALTRARRESLALQGGGLVWLHASGNDIAFARPFTHADGRPEVAICAVSRSSKPGTLKLEVTRTGVRDGAWRDAATNETFTARDGALEVNVSSPRVLVPS